jgi:hypothetical protein
VIVPDVPGALSGGIAGPFNSNNTALVSTGESTTLAVPACRAARRAAK